MGHSAKTFYFAIKPVGTKKPRTDRLLSMGPAGTFRLMTAAADKDTLPALLSYCTSERRVCPHPIEWNRLWQSLPNLRRDGSGWKSPTPLILALWWSSSDAQKRNRLADHVQWAADNGALSDFAAKLRTLPADRWHYEPSPAERAHQQSVVAKRRERAEVEHERAVQRRIDRAREVEAHRARKRLKDARCRKEIGLDLIAAYSAAEYVVSDGTGISLVLGEANAELGMLLARHNVQEAAFITAHNPYSVPFDAMANCTTQRLLETEVAAGGHAFIPGYGQSRDGSWPAEASILILGITKRDAKALARKYGQNAILWISASGEPSLILLPVVSDIS